MDKIEKHDNTEFTIDVQALAAENRSRNEGLQVPYDRARVAVASADW